MTLYDQAVLTGAIQRDLQFAALFRTTTKRFLDLADRSPEIPLGQENSAEGDKPSIPSKGITAVTDHAVEIQKINLVSSRNDEASSSALLDDGEAAAKALGESKKKFFALMASCSKQHR